MSLKDAILYTKYLIYAVDYQKEEALRVIQENMPERTWLYFPALYQAIFHAWCTGGARQTQAALKRTIVELYDAGTADRAMENYLDAKQTVDADATEFIFNGDMAAIAEWTQAVRQAYVDEQAHNSVQEYLDRAKDEPELALQDHIASLLNLQQIGAQNGMDYQDIVVRQALNDLPAILDGGSLVEELPFLSEVLSGFGGMGINQATIIASWEKNGKTSLIEQEAFHQARLLARQNRPGCVVLASVESGSWRDINFKEAGRLTGLDIALACNWNTRDIQRYKEALQSLKDLPVWATVRKDINPSGMQATLRVLRAKYGAITMVVLDPLEMLRPESRFSGNYENKIKTTIVDWLSMLSEFNCAVVFVHHGNRPSRQNAAIDPRDLNTSWLRYAGQTEAYQILWPISFTYMYPYLSDGAKEFFGIQNYGPDDYNQEDKAAVIRLASRTGVPYRMVLAYLRRGFIWERPAALKNKRSFEEV